MRPVEGVIFDLYGTLIRLDRDSRPYLRLARQARPANPRDLVHQALLLDAPSLGDVVDRLGLPRPDDLATLESDLRRDVESARLFEDSFEILEGLRGRELRLGLISNLASPYKEPFHRLGLTPYFDVALFSCDVGLCKPEPEIYLQMAKALALASQNAVMIGDSLRCDYDGPRAVGMEAVLLRRDGAGGKPRTIASLTELQAAIGL